MVRLLNEFTVVCKTTEEGEKLCSCDFRVNMYECPHSGFYLFVGKILVVVCFLSVAIASGLLVYLSKIKKQSFFLPADKDRGWIRPRPVQSYHLIVFVYMIFEGLNLLALINEWYANVTLAEFGYILSNTFTASTAIFYTVSIVYSTPNVQFNKNYEPLNREKGINTRLVDAIGIILFIQPIVTWIPLAFLNGHLVEMKNFRMANIVFTIRFLLFVLWQLIYIVVVAYFWHKLMYVIKSYIKVLEERCLSTGTTESSYIENIKRGTKSITYPVMALIGGLSFQAIIYTVKAFTYRNSAVFYFGWNVFYFWMEYVAFPLLALSVESTLLYLTIVNHKALKNKSPTSSKLSSSHSSSQTQVDSEIDMEDNNMNNMNNKRKSISVVLCCGSGSSKDDDDTVINVDNNNSNNLPKELPSTIIHCTSETVTSIEDIIVNETNETSSSPSN